MRDEGEITQKQLDALCDAQKTCIRSGHKPTRAIVVELGELVLLMDICDGCYERWRQRSEP
jgi:hypothetical protein